jgi:hypothetical protein
MLALTDNLLAGAENNGFYVIGASDGPWSPPGWPNGTPPLDQLVAADKRYAQHFNGHTAMMMYSMGEADQQYGWYKETGQAFDADFVDIRKVNSTIPYLAWYDNFILAETATPPLNGISVEDMLGTYMPDLWTGGGAVFAWEAYFSTNGGVDLTASNARIQSNGYPTLQLESNPSDSSQGSPPFSFDINRIQNGQSDAFANSSTPDADYDGGYNECTGVNNGFITPWPAD